MDAPRLGARAPSVEEPARTLERRLEVARHSGVPAPTLERYREAREGDESSGIEAIRAPDRELRPGVEVETDQGAWQVHETPGHAPSHVVLHQPERRLLISGDQLLGRTVLFFDHGHTADPVGEFLASLDLIEPLEVDLCLPGHGRTFRDPAQKIDDARRQAAEMRQRLRALLEEGEQTAFGIVAAFIGEENAAEPASVWMLQIVLSLLDHMALAGEVAPIDGSDPRRWTSRSLRAMASFTFEREVAAPPQTVFDVLTDHRRYAAITPMRKSVLECEGEPPPNGVGAIRVLARSGRRCASG